MKEILLAKYGEIALKGLNKPTFESALLKTIRRRVELAGIFKVHRAQSTVYIEPQDENADVTAALEQLKRVFGLSALNRAAECKKDVDEISRTALEYLGEELKCAGTCKVSAKRSDKNFPLNSMELASAVADVIFDAFPHLKADMKKPDIEVIIEIRETAAYVHGPKINAAGGLPSGTSGRAAVMLSGGIDSPVAAHAMAKRGLDLVAVHFMSPPYTSEYALDKVQRLASVISRWSGNLPLVCIKFTDIQVLLKEKCPEELFTVLMRRSMMRITNMVCECEGGGAIITGESLAQVASQTLSAIACTDASAKYPVLRPLIGSDKIDISDTARAIGTFDISILDYADCCTVFTPKHPKTRPMLSDLEKAEGDVPELAELEREAFENRTVKVYHFFDEE